ncbi:MAG: YdeI/OmpD-associated family protein [Coriobacteriia bacterium]
MTTRLESLAFVEPGSREEWRAWLEKHHASSPGIWLAVGKKGNHVTSLDYDAAVEEALCFGWIDSTVNRLDADRFKQLFTPRRRGGTWSRSNKARVERLIAAGRMAPAGLAAIEAARRDGSWDVLEAVENLVVPEELARSLAADPRAEQGFAALPESQRKMALYRVYTAKRPETRARRVREIVQTAAEGRTPLA